METSKGLPWDQHSSRAAAAAEGVECRRRECEATCRAGTCTGCAAASVEHHSRELHPLEA
jgi:hypothetical protein